MPIKKTIKLLTTLFYTFCLILSVVPNTTYAEPQSTVDSLSSQNILWTQTEGDTTIICYVIDAPPATARVTSKSIIIGYRVLIDNVYSYTIRHDITFAYGIPLNGSHVAQITSGSAYVSYCYGNGTYQ